MNASPLSRFLRLGCIWLLVTLAAHRAGAADLPALRQLFAQAANAIVRATVVPRGEGWLDRTLGKI